MRRPFRLFLVPAILIAACFLVCMLFASLDRIVFWALNLSTIPGPDAEAKLLPMAFCYFGYGCVRVFYSTPWIPHKFTHWLLATPWTPAKPLPFETAHLAWQDAFIVLLSVPISAMAGLDRAPIAAFCFISAALIVGAYLFCTAVALRLHGWVAHSYTIILGMTLVPAFGFFPQPLPIVLALAAVVLLYVVASKGRTRAFEKLVADSIRAPEVKRDPSAWWPSALNPLWPVPFRDALMVSGYTGLFAFFIGNDAYMHAPGEFVSGSMAGLFMCAIVCGILRFCVYVFPMDRSGSVCSGYLPPIGVFGRIATGRLIIPGYDQVLAAPICAVIVPYVCLELLLKFQLYPPLATAISMALIPLIALGSGPALRTWQLTGQHRIVNLQPKTLPFNQRKKMGM